MNEPNEPGNSPTPEPTLTPTPTPTPEPTPELNDDGTPKSLVNEPEPKEPATEPVEFVPLTADDLTFPEEFEVDAEIRDRALEVFNDRTLSPKEQMQSLVDLQLEAAKKASEASSNAWTEMQETWKGEVKADPEIGGDKLQPTLARVSRLVAEYGPEGVNEVFDLTGAGNNPLMIKFLNNIASKLVEGGAVQGAPTAGTTESAASRLFPSMKGNG